MNDIDTSWYPGDVPPEEPDTGSVVALNWGGPYQEAWVSNSANVGNWYTPDAIVPGHPNWYDLLERAKAMQAPMTLLVASDKDTYRTGYRAGVQAAKSAVENALDWERYANPEAPDA